MKAIRFILICILITFLPTLTFARNDYIIIEDKTFDKGLVVENKINILIRNCIISNKDGKFGIRLSNCKNIRIENCVIRNVGNESLSDYISTSFLPNDEKDYPQKKGHFDTKGIYLENCFNITVFDCDVTDVFGQGIKVYGDDYTKTGDIILDKNRIAYTYDDAIKFEIKGDQDDNGGKKSLPFKGGIVRNNLIHDIGLGTTQLPFARHGMYLKARDILVEGNTIYNCFYGQGISLRNAGIIRNNKVWNCYGGLCIAYWAQTSTTESSKEVIIENNQCRQDHAIDFRMRHISNLSKNPDTSPQPMILIAYGQNQADAIIDKFIVRGNTCIANQDYLSEAALIGGSGSPRANQTIIVENNKLIDNRAKKIYYKNIPLSIKSTMKMVADWQLNHFEESVNKVYKWPNDHKLWAWTNGVLYTGIVEMAKMTGDMTYWNFLKNIGQKEDWKLGTKLYHADDICVGQMYAGLYEKFKNKSMIEPTKKSLQFIIENPKNTALDFSVPNNQDRWSWSDALFMAPPTFAKIGKITGNKKYFDFMDKEFWTTHDTLYSKKDSLFFRDTRYKSKKEANGQNVYWARGNGWVIGGLAIIIDNLPENHPNKQKYIALFKQMIQRIAHLQDEKGFWHPSLLDYKTYPMPESSSSSFFTYGLAWGINRGYLDRKTFEPVARKGWKALTTAIHHDGKLGWVQEIGADPTKVSFEDTEVYGVGAFLLAGSEFLKL